MCVFPQTANTSRSPSVKIHYVRSPTKEDTAKCNHIHIHTVVMKVPVICFWVLIPPRQVCVCQSDGEQQREEDKCDSDASKRCVLIRRIQICLVFACPTHRCDLRGRTHHVSMHGLVYLIDCAHLCLCQGNVCLKDATWGQQAVQRHQLFIHGLVPQEPCLHSADSPGTEERRTDTVATLLTFTFCFLFPPFILLC